MNRTSTRLESWCSKLLVTPVALLALLVTSVAFLSTSAIAQSFYGSVVGTVADSSGAVVPDATVKITNSGTNETHTVKSDASGKFSVVNLVPADYRIEVTKDNFKRFVREHVPVQVGATVRVDSELAVGNASETVQVSTAAPLLQTDSSTLGQAVEGAQVQEMPLNGRNVMNLIALAPGVVPTGGSQGDTGLNQGTRTGGGTGWGNYQIGGAIQGQSAQYLDGVPNNLLGGNTVGLVPTQDAIQEFNVASSNAGADFGRFAGGVVNMTTKSGSNAFHGSLYEYLRNRDFNANDYFSNLSGKPRVQWNQNQYGAAVNGPIKKDKAFFMFTWEAFKAMTGSVSTTNVPTAALQSGQIPGNILTGVQPYCAAATYNAATNVTTIPQSCWDPLNTVLKNYYPAPNTAGNGFNWYYAGPLGNKQNQYNGRVDYNLSTNNRLFGRYTYWNLQDAPAHSEFGQQGYNGSKWATDDGHVIDKVHQGVLGDTYTINPTTVLDVRANYMRLTSPNYPATVSQNETVFDQFSTNKNYAALAPQMSVHGLPGFGLNGSYGFYGLANFPGYSVNWYNTYGVNANLVKIMGAHSLKFGAEVRLMDGSGSGFDNTESGQYQYSNSPGGSNNWPGDDWAAFLLGYPTQITFTTIANTAPYTWYQAYYVTDTWQATHNLTLNLGLRYELPGAISERNNKAFVLLPNANDPVQTAIKGTLQLVNSPLYSNRSTVVPKQNLFAPRVGFAYRASANTVVRGGYGISYLPSDIEGGLFSYNQSINSAQTQYNFSTSGNPTQLQTSLGCIAGTVTGATCTAINVNAGLNQPIGRTKPDIIGAQKLASATAFLNKNISGPVPYQSYPYTQQWNAALSHQFKGDMMAEISYSGLKGTNIPGIGSRNLNQLPDSFDSLGAGLKASATCGGLTVTVAQCDRPFTYYNNVSDTAETYARENYRSFQARVEKRMGAAGVLNGNYTWARNTGNTDTQNGFIESKSSQQGGSGNGGVQDWNNLNAEYSLISYDVTNRAVVNYVVNLPFGKGQKFANSLNGVGNALASGWAVNGITTFQSGFPVFFSSGTPNQLTNFGSGTTRPSIVQGCSKVNSGSGLARAQAGAWFNTSCFQYAGDYAFGNEPRVDPNVRADGQKNFDFSFQKSTPIREGANFEFRAEFFNILNRVQFAPPGNSAPVSNTCVVWTPTAYLANGLATNSNTGSQNCAKSSTFGTVTYQVNKPRQIQLSARINF